MEGEIADLAKEKRDLLSELKVLRKRHDKEVRKGEKEGKEGVELSHLKSLIKKSMLYDSEASIIWSRHWT